MNPKEKAKELVEKFLKIGLNVAKAKYCAVICVDEILKANWLHPNDTYYDYNKAEEYCQQVRKEIELLTQ